MYKRQLVPRRRGVNHESEWTRFPGGPRATGGDRPASQLPIVPRRRGVNHESEWTRFPGGPRATGGDRPALQLLLVLCRRGVNPKRDTALTPTVQSRNITCC